MEGALISPFNLGILVEKEVVVHTNEKPNGDSVASHLSSVVSIVRSTSDARRESGTPEPQEIISPLPSGKMLPRPDVSVDDQGDLADFFRRSPPPGNFMSIPDDVSISSADGKWGVFKVFRKRRRSKKRKKRQPPLIKLPDTAVSSRTIEGHRYIAISIPSGCSPSGPAPSEHHPASQPIQTEPCRTVDPLHNPMSDGGKQSFRPVTEDHGSLSSASLAPKRPSVYPEEVTRLAPPPRKVSLLSTVPSQEETSLGKGKEAEKRSESGGGVSNEVLMNPLESSRVAYAAEPGPQLPKQGQTEQKETPTSDTGHREYGGGPPMIKQPGEATNEPALTNSFTAKSNLRESSKHTGTPRVRSPNTLAVPTLPVRTSSRRAATAVSGPSDVGNIAGSSRPAPVSRAVSSNNGGNGNGNSNGNGDGNGGTTGPRGSFAESLMTESSPKLLKAQTATAYQSVPIIVRPPSDKPEVESPLNLNFPAPPSNKVHVSAQADTAAPPEAAEGSVTRKDRVRERKKRDMERVKAQMRQHQAPTLRLLRPEAPAEHLWPESPVLGRFNEELGSPSSRPFLTTKMSDIGPIRPGVYAKSPYLPPEATAKKLRRRSTSAPTLTSSSSPSSLEHRSMPWEDSRAYYRQREQQAEREEHEARRARYIAHVLAEEEETEDWALRQKLLRRYEKLKESRTKDMEKRLRRLERNGEVLMESLVSLMGTLNKVLQDRHFLQRGAYPEPHDSPRRRSQSLRSVRSLDNLAEISRSQPERAESHFQRFRPRSLHVSHSERRARGGRVGTETRPFRNPLQEEGTRTNTRLRQSALEALQAQLQPGESGRGAQTRDIPRYSRSTGSSDHSDETGSLEIMEPLMRELREAAGFGAERRRAESVERRPEEGRTLLSESEIFNLF